MTFTRHRTEPRYIDLPLGEDGVYRVVDPGVQVGEEVVSLWTIGEAIAEGREVDVSELDDDAEMDLYRRVLGGTYDQIKADGFGFLDIKDVATTAMIWMRHDKETAEKYWDAARGDQGEDEAEAPKPNRVTRRASAAAARTTRKPGSTSGTRAPRSTSAKKAP